MNDFVYKSVSIKGNLKKSGKLFYRPCPNNELRNTLSCLSIASIAFIAKKEIETPCFITCNFVKSQKFDENSRIESYENTLQSFLINNQKYQLTRYNFSWFKFNSLSEELVFSFKNFEDDLLKDDVDVTLTVNFR